MPEEVTDVRVVAPLRCCDLERLSPVRVCGEPAKWMRAGPGLQPDGYYCDVHRRPDDVRVPDSFVFRRVTIKLDAVFTGASFILTPAHQEAFDRLARAVEGAGGLVNLHAIDSRVCRYTPHAPVSKGKGGAWGR